MLKELLTSCRTVRKFSQKDAPCVSDLRAAVENARLTPSAANRQRVRFSFVLGDDAEKLFSSIRMGGYLPAEQKPTADQKPTAYITLMTAEENPDKFLLIDLGIVSEALVLSLAEAGFGSCIIGSFEREAFATRDGLYPQLVIAVGRSAEPLGVVCDAKSGDIKYFINEDGANVVPKLTADELIV